MLILCITLVLSNVIVDDVLPITKSDERSGNRGFVTLDASSKIEFGESHWGYIALSSLGKSHECTVSLVGSQPTALLGVDPLRRDSNDRTISDQGADFYRGAVYRNAWPGIDIHVAALENRIRYDLRICAGSDLSKVQFECTGLSPTSIDSQGGLVFSSPLGFVTHTAPKAWQEHPDGRRDRLKVALRILDQSRFGFVVSGWDPSLDLLIDPTITFPMPGSLGGSPKSVQWSSVFGGEEHDTVFSTHRDPRTGYLYIGGTSYSQDFPTRPGAYDLTYNGSNGYHAGDVMVLCVDPSRAPEDQLLWSTFIGGPYQEHVQDIVTDELGNVYVLAMTTAYDEFPTTPGAYSHHNARAGSGERQGAEFFDLLLIRLSPDGSQLLYSSFIGGDNRDHPSDLVIAPEASVNGVRDILVVGITGRGYGSPPVHFPMTPGAYDTEPDQGAGSDAMFFRFRMDDSLPPDEQLVYSSFFGGQDREYGSCIAVFPGGVVIGGETLSEDLPTVDSLSFQPDKSQSSDAFVAAFSMDLSKPPNEQLLFCTYLGALANDFLYAMEYDPTLGDIVLAGYTTSPNFPMAGQPFQNSLAGDYDGFVTRMNTSGTAISASTYIGGTDYERVLHVGVDSIGNVTLGGFTRSGDYPTTDNAFSKAYGGGGADGMVSRLDPSLSTLSFSSYIGGSGWDSVKSISFDGSQNPVVSGSTESPDFALHYRAFDQTHNGAQDMFVFWFDLN